jgi:uncharacterized membrane protein YfcA
MAEPPTSPNPLGDLAPKVDLVPVAGWSVATGIAATVAWYAGLTYLTARMVAGSTVASPAQVNPDAFSTNFLIYGFELGAGVGALVAWLLMREVDSRYRRGALSLVAAFAGAASGIVLTAVLEHLINPAALLVLLVAALMLAVWLGNKARVAGAVVRASRS